MLEVGPTGQHSRTATKLSPASEAFARWQHHRQGSICTACLVELPRAYRLAAMEAILCVHLQRNYPNTATPADESTS